MSSANSSVRGHGARPASRSQRTIRWLRTRGARAHRVVEELAAPAGRARAAVGELVEQLVAGRVRPQRASTVLGVLERGLQHVGEVALRLRRAATARPTRASCAASAEHDARRGVEQPEVASSEASAERTQQLRVERGARLVDADVQPVEPAGGLVEVQRDHDDEQQAPRTTRSLPQSPPRPNRLEAPERLTAHVLAHLVRRRPSPSRRPRRMSRRDGRPVVARGDRDARARAARRGAPGRRAARPPPWRARRGPRRRTARRPRRRRARGGTRRGRWRAPACPPPSPRAARSRSSRRRCSARRRRRPSGASRAFSSSLTRPRRSTRSRSPRGTSAERVVGVARAGDEQLRRPGTRVDDRREAPRAGPAGPCAARRCGRGTRGCRRRAASRRSGSAPANEATRRRWGSARRRRRGASTSVCRAARAHRDAGAELLQRRLQDRRGRGHRARARRRGVERADHRADARPAGEQRQARRGRLVHVQDVEVALAQPAAHPRGGHGAERQPGDRAVVRHGHGAPGRRRRTAAARRRRRPGRAPRPRARARSASRRGRGRATCTPPGTSQEYGQTRPILTRGLRPSAASARPSTSSTQSGCSMCQSSGCSAMPRSNERRRRAGSSRRRAPGGRVDVGTLDRRRGAGRACGRRPSYQRSTVSSGAPVQVREHRRSAGHPRASRRRTSTVDAGAGQVAVGGQARPARRRAAVARSVRDDVAAAGQRQHLHARATRGSRRTGRTATRAAAARRRW